MRKYTGFECGKVRGKQFVATSVWGVLSRGFGECDSYCNLEAVPHRCLEICEGAESRRRGVSSPLIKALVNILFYTSVQKEITQ